MTSTLTLLKRPHILAPHSLEISILFKDFIRYWMGWQIHLDEEPKTIPQAREWQVAFRGSIRGNLAIRSNGRLLSALWDNQISLGRDFPTAEAAFREMASLFATHLAKTFWNDRFMDLDPLMARPMEALERPSSFQCHTYCGFLLNGEPLEIRFWLDPGTERPKESRS